jgi:hypothetical protein
MHEQEGGRSGGSRGFLDFHEPLFRRQEIQKWGILTAVNEAVVAFSQNPGKRTTCA